MFSKISQNWQENTCIRVSFLIKLLALVLQLYEKETLTQSFSGEICEIFKNYFPKYLLELLLVWRDPKYVSDYC